MYDNITVQDSIEDDDGASTSFSEQTDGNGTVDEELDEDDSLMIED